VSILWPWPECGRANDETGVRIIVDASDKSSDGREQALTREERSCSFTRTSSPHGNSDWTSDAAELSGQIFDSIKRSRCLGRASLGNEDLHKELNRESGDVLKEVKHQQ
jgi:hypothetical protein